MSRFDVQVKQSLWGASFAWGEVSPGIKVAKTL